MYRNNRFLSILLLTVLLLSACQPVIQPVAEPAASAPSAAYTPRYEPGDCFYEIPEGEQVECGYLIVPEDRSQPDGPTIKVHVVNFKSKSATPKPDPIILVPGGPGAARGLYIYLWTAAPVAEVMRADRDVIMIEQRGANYSEPAFYCPEMEADLSQLAGMSLPEEIAWSATAYKACGERLAKEGHNLSVYGSLDAAADIADLRVAMGYNQVNIYGVSAGTLPTMHLMRDYPTGIRSVILDSSTPPELNLTNAMLKTTQAVLNAVFQRCAADVKCNAAYPDLQTVFYQSLADLRAKPVSVTVQDEAGNSYDVTVDDLIFMQYIYDNGYVGDAYAGLPMAMYTAHNGNFAAIAQDWLAYLSGRHSKAAPGTDTWSMGLYNTVTCLHDGVDSDVRRAKAIYASMESEPSLQAWTEQAYAEEYLGPCASWPITITQPEREMAPVVSKIPTMMWVGAFDLAAVPFFSEPSVAGLLNSYRFAFPRSHGLVLSECALETVKPFLAAPSKAPDASCIDEMTLDWVLPEE